MNTKPHHVVMSTTHSLNILTCSGYRYTCIQLFHYLKAKGPKGHLHCSEVMYIYNSLHTSTYDNNVNKSNIENLERLNECPQQDSYRVSLSKQLDKASSTKQSQETEIDETVLLYARHTMMIWYTSHVILRPTLVCLCHQAV